MTLHLPEFSSNTGSGAERRTVAGDISATVAGIVASDQAPLGVALDVASAYFNAAGYGLIADAFDGVGPVRLLLGAEPTDAQVRETVTSLQVRGAHKGNPVVTAAIRAHEEALIEDRDLAGFGREVDELIERLIGWLERGDVQVRKLNKGFLHGKAFLLGFGAGSVLAGSSNLTRAGLAHSRELNVGVYNPGAVGQVRDWFDEQWDAADAYDLAELYRARRVPHDPHLVFMRMLLALYGDEVAEEPDIDNELGLAPHQLDGVFRARRILARRRGVIIADEVGLGKTYIAGELIREATMERRQKVLVVAPAALRDTTWNPFLHQMNLPATVASFEQLVAELDPEFQGLRKIPSIDDIAMVIVDEAHHIRNAGTERASAMRHLLSGKVGKDLVMLSATPVNNSLQDLYNLLGYINPSDSAFADVGVTSLSEYFKRAMALDPDELSGEHLFDVLDAIAVRRTRRFIQTQYPGLKLPNGEPIVFPQAVVHRVDYRLDDVLPDFFPRFAAALGKGLDDKTDALPGSYLTMARYLPSRYDAIEGDAQHEVQNAGLLQSALLKRFESSSAAFCSTLRVMQKSHEQFLAALDRGWVLTGKALSGWVSTDSDDVEAYVTDLDDEHRDNAEEASSYDVEALRNDVLADHALLREFEQEVAQVDWRKDPKIAALVEELAAVAAKARLEGHGADDTRDRRKVLMFTYFADTANYVYDAITQLIEEDERLADYRGRIVRATGGDKAGQGSAIVGFSPRTAAPGMDAEDKYDLVIATDVLSEGVNLQQAGHIINYDLPWNPMRLVQRHGRIDRIGSTHTHIHLRCFFPDEQLEELLALETRLQMKLKHAAAAFGADEVLPGMKPVERNLTETREEIQKLRDEDASIFKPDRAASASSEEFQRRLQRALSDKTTAEAIHNLPWGAGTGLRKAGAQSGVVFCMVVADHPMPFFRFVPMDVGPDGAFAPIPAVDGAFEVDDSRLPCLNLADPGEKTVVPHLTEAMHQAVFDAWPIARDHVYTDWMEHTDPAKIQPKIPKAMRDAAMLVRDHGSALGEQQDRLEKRFGQVVEARYQTLVRQTIQEHEGSPEQGVLALKTLADQLRLPVPEPVRPFAPIQIEDVRVLAWVAVAPDEAR